jgi:alkanesulfonate monooxygenase SsuD/methylene tetrahydromethanopterin reductase-like flavin-dependent oxidoreductase (luciferase family)
MVRGRRKWALLLSGDNLSLADMVGYARSAADAGAESVWTCEIWRDGFVPLAAIACAAPGVRVGTGIVQFARPPVLTELAAMSMAELTAGRFVLGLGVAPKEWNESWHGLRYANPVRRMREYIDCLRGMWASSAERPFDYDGEYFHVRRYARFVPASYERIPIYLGITMPAMMRLAGSHADGVIVNTLNTPAYIRDVVHRNVRAGMAAAGRTDAPFEFTAIKCCAVSRDAKRAIELARHIVAFYSTLPYFDAVLDPAGFTTQKNAIRAAMQRNDRAAMLRAVTDEMVTTLTLAGTPDDVHRQLDAFDGCFETALLFCPFFGVDPAETKANHEAMIEAFAH